ncbi:extracellular solute-binding protein [Labrys wisconsinensis]|uniref:Multiple sugar transport system substrate-binding protein n=1 Tax=Labrys wisconsinensis TaxID=425677 RepID=A0ABU0J5K4_9HYPH|nr:extracellular solute-binding protein [Labrys wisconsinensis]MDQ0469535.1 multiple sugar transport system substrate-binding protein [Labrys wisconsinensis]
MAIDRRSLLIGSACAVGALAAPMRIAAAAAVTTIRISVYAGYETMLGDLAARFSAIRPDIAVDYVVRGDNWDPLLQMTLRDSLVGGLPDGTWQYLTYAPLLARRGIVQPLDPLFGGDRAELQALGITRAMIEAVSVKGSVLALPFGTTIPVVYYNMDLLRRAGYAAATLPSTWQEIVEIGTKVAALDRSINGGYIEYDSTNEWVFQNLLAGFGGRMMNAEQTGIAFAGPEGRQALQVLWDLGATSTADMTYNQARQAFNAGTTGVHIRSASGTTSVAKAAAGRFELQVGQVPIPSQTGWIVGAGHGFMMFTRDAARQKALWDFMRFAAGPEGQMILARRTGYMPVNMLALNDPAFLERYLQINPYHRAIVDRLAITSDQFSFPADNTVEIADMMAAAMREVVRRRTRPDQALAAMAEQTRKLLKLA